MLHGPRKTQKRAAELRKALSLPEVLLWMALRKHPGGLRFRKQHPAGSYILDFFCPRWNFAIEVDGEAHACGNRPERDAARDVWLASEGVRVLRIPAKEVLGNMENVLRHVVAFARG